MIGEGGCDALLIALTAVLSALAVLLRDANDRRLRRTGRRRTRHDESDADV